MKRIFLPFVILSSVIFLCASCLEDSNDTEFVFADDTAITGFTLGTLNRLVHTTDSAGNDSTYVAALDASRYKFYIDQIKREIYNVDSLPVGTDNSRVICNITSKNSGVIVIKDIDSDTLRYHTGTDSIDFSEPREISVYDMAGTGKRTYKVSVNVHREYGDSVTWSHVATEPQFAGTTAMKAVENNGSIFVFGTDGVSTHIYSSSASDGSRWKPVTPNFNMPIPADAYDNIAVKDGSIYLLFNNMLMKSADASNWETVYAGSAIARLIGAGSRKLYALDGNGGIMASEDGSAWTQESLDGDARMLPDADICFAAVPLRTNVQTERVIMVGNHRQQINDTDTAAVVWSRIEEYASGSENHSWTFYDNTDKKLLPRLDNLVMTYYDGRLIAFGGKEKDGGKTDAFAQMYVSTDNGLTWHGDSRYYFPDDFSSSATSFAFVKGTDNFIWVICGATGQVWRARLNKLGWTQYQTSFSK